MKRIYLNVILMAFFVPSLSYAQGPSMRSLAASQLYLYGQATYDRGNLPEAAPIFSRILWLDPMHKDALKTAQKLRDKGYRVFIPIMPPAGVTKTIPVKVKVETPPDPNADLKQNIQQVDEDIEKIKKEVVDLRHQIDQGQKDQSL